jgi:hypothetical protein
MSQNTWQEKVQTLDVRILFFSFIFTLFSHKAAMHYKPWACDSHMISSVTFKTSKSFPGACRLSPEVSNINAFSNHMFLWCLGYWRHSLDNLSSPQFHFCSWKCLLFFLFDEHCDSVLNNFFISLLLSSHIPECKRNYFSPWFGHWLSHLSVQAYL